MSPEAIVQKLSIGIPSYNEEQNIANLLRSLESDQSIISEVIISDDSQDATPDIIQDFARKSVLNIIFFHHNERRGAASAWNEIFQRARGDVIVLYDADTIPHPSCTVQLASRINEDNVLCASNSEPVQASGIAGRASVFTSNWLRSVRLCRLSQYTVMGRALAIESSVARKIQVPEDIIAIDLYLQCVVHEMSLGITYNDDAIVYFKPANNIRDLASQVIRAINGHDQIKDRASRLGINLPPHIAALQALKNAIADPVNAVSALLGYSVIPLHMLTLNHTNSAKWHTAESSKALNYQDLQTRF